MVQGRAARAQAARSHAPRGAGVACVLAGMTFSSPLLLEEKESSLVSVAWRAMTKRDASEEDKRLVHQYVTMSEEDQEEIRQEVNGLVLTPEDISQITRLEGTSVGGKTWTSERTQKAIRKLHETMDSIVEACTGFRCKALFLFFAGREELVHPETGELVISRKYLEGLAANSVEEGSANMVYSERMRRLFSIVDVDNSGTISFREFALLHCLTILAVKMKDHRIHVELQFRLLDIDKDGAVSPDEFMYWAKMMADHGALKAKPEDVEETVRSWMRQYDVDHDGSITRKEFRKLVRDVDFSYLLPPDSTLSSLFPFREAREEMHKAEASS